MDDNEERAHFRDVLIETNTLLKSHMESFREHQERMSQRIDNHEQSDAEHFNRLYGSIGTLRKYLYMGIGAVAAFEVAIKFFKE